MIREDLLEFQYYLDRLSKFMQESYGIDEQVRTFWSILEQVNSYYDEFFNEIDFFHTTYKDGNPLLNKIGHLFGCERNFTIRYWDQDALEYKYTSVDLNDDEYLIYIKTQVIKQNFDGRRETLQKLYSTWKDNKPVEGIINLRFLYTTEENERSNAVCTIRWDTNTPSENLRKLFENGYLTIESIGIRYIRQIVNFNEFAYYYKSGETPTIYNYYAIHKYEVLSTIPDDWHVNDGYKNYFQIVEQSLADEPDAPAWADNTYYRKSGLDYILIENKPANWDGAYIHYYTLTITPNNNSTFTPNAFYKYTMAGGRYS